MTDPLPRRRTPRALFWEMQGFYTASRRYYREGRLRAFWGTLRRGWRD